MADREGKIYTLLNNGELEQVEANPGFAIELFQGATCHLVSVSGIIDFDSAGAFQLGYGAARKACTALLAQPGLRSTRMGGHVAVAEAVRAQFNGPRGNTPLGRLTELKRRRGESEYPSALTPSITWEDAAYCRGLAQEIVDAVGVILNSGRLGEFGH